MAEIYLAGGCFWGVEEYFSRLEGVLETTVGYSNGKSEVAEYKLLKHTEHAETVAIKYDEDKISLRTILLHYFRIIDPLSLNKQGNDIGRQYRTGIYYIDSEDTSQIEEVMQEQTEFLGQRPVVEVEPLQHYILAEGYHQDYLKKNPNGYCHIDVNRAKEPLVDPSKYLVKKEEVLSKLTEKQVYVTQDSGTEERFTNEFYEHFDKGLYVDIVTGEPLFFSKDKYECSCGWPSFAKTVNYDVVRFYKDNSHNMERIEVRSRVGDSHLGHVFPDGPEERGGLRFCINSAALKFIPEDKMEENGYEYLKEYL